MKVTIGNQAYTGSRKKFRQALREIDTAPETRDLPARKRERIKDIIESALAEESLRLLKWTWLFVFLGIAVAWALPLNNLIQLGLMNVWVLICAMIYHRVK